MEQWACVPGTGGKIYVSNEGRVKSFLREMENGRILAQSPDRKGYMRVRVTIGGIKQTHKVHRLVASAFVKRLSEQQTFVNHMDGNKKNNRSDNLEWVTALENAHHAISTGLWENNFMAAKKENERRQRPIVATCATTGKQKYFKSVSDAERFFNSRHISDVLNGKREKAAGHYFRDAGGDDLWLTM